MKLLATSSLKIFLSALVFPNFLTAATLSATEKEKLEDLNSQLELIHGTATCDDKHCTLLINSFTPLPFTKECIQLGYQHKISTIQASDHLLLAHSTEKSKFDEFVNVVDDITMRCLYDTTEQNVKETKLEDFKFLKENRAEYDEFSLSSDNIMLWPLLNDNTTVKGINLHLNDMSLEWPILAESVARNESIEKLWIHSFNYNEKTALKKSDVNVGDLSIFKKLKRMSMMELGTRGSDHPISLSNFIKMIESASTKCPFLTHFDISPFSIPDLKKEKDFFKLMASLSKTVVPNLKDGVSFKISQLQLDSAVKTEIPGLSMDLAKSVIDRNVNSRNYIFHFRIDRLGRNLNAFAGDPFQISSSVNSNGAVEVTIIDGTLNQEQRKELIGLAKKYKKVLILNTTYVVKKEDFEL